MESYLLDWTAMLLRWLHVIAGIAWIGASFYFVWLDNHLEKPQDPTLIAKGVDGELWAVHGGGFYNPQKYLTAPAQLPPHLHWFYWESYTTWMSGMALFTAVYLLNPRAYLIDPQILPMSPMQACIAALGFLTMGWFVYDGICRLLKFQDKKVGVAVGIYVGLASYIATSIFAGRAAFLLLGAMLATIMSANVFFWIIPGQRKVVAALRKGDPIDPQHGKRGKQRSVHNTYFTLPVLFCMLSNHFAALSHHKYNAIILILMMLAGVFIRQYFILRHKGQNQYLYPVLAFALFSAVFLLTKPNSPPPILQGDKLQTSVSLESIFSIVKERCHGCHAVSPQLMSGGAPKGIAFESPKDLETWADQIYKQAVELKIMPLGNITNITDQEREQIARWYKNRRG